VTLVRLAVGFVAACFIMLWRLTTRFHVVDDPRPALRAARQRYTYALLHAHQLGAMFISDEPVAAMLSRSTDGDFMVPLMWFRKTRPVRGSTRKRGVDKGGRAALETLVELVSGGLPALIAVDGPRGPRNFVNRGIAELACRCDAAVLPVVVVPERRWILSAAWDRFQIPAPFSRLTMAFAPPIRPAGRDVEAVRLEVTETLAALERKWDPSESPPRN
jgi:lysophospholipid acyltransferase (LPLAT)-like uncharacterized protein